jgi:alkylation response protein AidB-like acyl-CoA dehydrogenase
VDVVGAARALASDARACAAETERERRLPASLVEAMADAGLFRVCVPATVGGVEASAAELVACCEEMARGDGAPAWCIATCGTTGLLAGFFGEDAAREVYASPRSVAGGVVAPRGRAVAVDGGYRVTGRWPFASGCSHCDWLLGGCVVSDGDAVRMLPNGMPDGTLMMARADEVVIHDTWHVSGLRGTGSHDIEMADVFVPSSRAASLFTDTPTATGPLFAFPLFGLLALCIGGVALGLGRGALDDLAELAAAKRPLGSTRTLAERAVAQAETAQAEAALRSARAFLYEAIGEAWEAAVAGGQISIAHRTSLRLAATHATTTGAAVCDTAYRLGGGSAIYESSPLQRRFRDAHTATQHLLVAPATWELTGRLLLGQETDATQL